jgi:tripartite-type tricarboxylate transporter receptor subunit TctC
MVGSICRRSQSRLAVTVVAVALSTLLGHGGWSQTTRTIKIIDPYAPGSPNGIVARLLADEISRARGPTFMIENRAGAGSLIGTEAASRAAADGNTLLIAAPGFVVIPHLRKLNYDPLTSFEPICLLVNSPNIIAVSSASSYRTLADLFNAARAMPGRLTLAGVGPASANQLAFEVLKRAANVDITFVSYPGGSQAASALLGDHVTSLFALYPNVVSFLNAGNLRALATTSRLRIDALPDVPTVAESGYPDYEANLWIGLFAPAKTPKDLLSQLANWFVTALQAPEVKAKLVAQGLYPVGICGAEFGAYVRKQYDEYGRIVRETNIKAD